MKRRFYFLIAFVFALIQASSLVMAAGPDLSLVGPQGVVGSSGIVGSDPSLVGPASSPSPDPSPTPDPATISGSSGAVGPVGSVGPDLSLVGPQASAVQDPSVTQTPLTSTQSNDNTGANSSNTNSTSANSTGDVTQNSTANIDNNIKGDLSTGNNNVHDNTSVGSVNTGDVDGAITLINVANSQFAPGSSIGGQSIDAGNAGSVAMGTSSVRTPISTLQTNNQTGSDSLNSNTVGATTDLTVVRNLDANANNNVDVTASTGGNQLSRNTKVGSLNTGNVDLAVNVVNLLNITQPDLLMTVDTWTLQSTNPQLNLDFSNGKTGSSSVNTNNADFNGVDNLNVSRLSNANNGINVTSNTGNNQLDQNSQVGDVTTGKTSVDANALTVANSDIPSFYLVNVMGPWDGTLSGVDPSQVFVNYLQAPGNFLNYTENSTANANTLLNVNADTGDNNISQNSQIDSIKTGNVNVLANIVNFMNTFGNGKKAFHLGIINLFMKPDPMTASAAASGSSLGGTSPADIPQVTNQLPESNGAGGFGFGTISVEPTNSDPVTPADPVMVTGGKLGTGSGHTGGTLVGSAGLNNTSGSSIVVSKVDDSAPTISHVTITPDGKAVVHIAPQDAKKIAWIPIGLAGLFLLVWGVIELMALKRNRYLIVRPKIAQ